MQRRNRNNSLCLFLLKSAYQQLEKKADQAWEAMIKFANEYKNSNDTSSQAKNKYLGYFFSYVSFKNNLKKLKENIRQLEERGINNNQNPNNNANNANVPANNNTNEIIMNNQPQPNNNIIINENDSINEVGERENPQQINNPQINNKEDQMLYKYDDLKKMIMEVMKNQTEINKKLQELKTEIQNTKEEMKTEIQKTKEEMKKEIQLINQRLKKLEDSFNKSRNAQIACFKDLVNKMENIDM